MQGATSFQVCDLVTLDEYLLDVGPLEKTPERAPARNRFDKSIDCCTRVGERKALTKVCATLIFVDCKFEKVARCDRIRRRIDPTAVDQSERFASQLLKDVNGHRLP